MNWRFVRATAQAYLVSIAFWFGISFLMGWQYGVLDRHNFWPSLISLMGMAAVRGFALALWTPPIFYLVGKYLHQSIHRAAYVLVCVLGAVPFVLLHSAIQWALITQVDDATHLVIARTFQSYLDLIRAAFADQIFIYIAVVVGAHAYEYLKRLRSEERQKYEYQQALAVSELQALKTQLHPHFLFNTLHGIATVVDGNSRGRDMIVKLADLLRRALERDSVDLVSFDEELTFVKEYVELEEMRFGNRLNIQWQIGPGTGSVLVPQMVLHLFVENAIRHGVCSAREGGWIAVAANQKDGMLDIEVRNSIGRGATGGTGVGLRNTEARLRYLYSGDASLHFAVSPDRVATASLRLPSLNGDADGQRVARHEAVGLQPL
jgi:two-component system, LytTR family, sensor kinase